MKEPDLQSSNKQTIFKLLQQQGKYPSLPTLEVLGSDEGPKLWHIPQARRSLSMVGSHPQSLS